MKRALILGGNRFFGARLVRRLKDAGWHVTLVNRQGTGEADSLIKASRHDVARLAPLLGGQKWDVVWDSASYGPLDYAPAVELFGGRTERYVLVSSIAVYQLGRDLTETDFDPLGFQIPDTTKRQLTYGEGKRAAEATFTRGGGLPLVSVRIPYVCGVDDHTKRLEVHIEAVKSGRELFFSSPSLMVDFISSAAVAEFLHRIAETTHLGPINYASAEPLSFGSLMELIGSVTGRPVRFATKQSATNGSPYELWSHKYMSLAKAVALGFEPAPIHSWLPEVIATLAR
jgi:nucleoside-diphosphate-sugar epimerase